MKEEVCITLYVSWYYSKTPADTSFIRQDLKKQGYAFKMSEIFFGTQ